VTHFCLHQRFRYDYSSPVRELEHRLMVLPPAVQGDQVRVLHRLEVHGAEARVVESFDRFGNVVVDVRAALVTDHVEFEIRVEADRLSGVLPTALGVAEHRRFSAPSPLTSPDPALRAAAADLGASGDRGLELADRINGWTHTAMGYRHGVTGVRTTAAEALALGLGVCQDYAHVMLTLCRLSGLSARYVSGHLQGEGGSHAWVEVLVPSGAVAFDPTNGRRAGSNYLTIAVGRDYADVAPTCGTFRGTGCGVLTTSKELRVGAPALVTTSHGAL